ncbi:Sister chromatid cohesion protein SCC2/Nipped-B [Phaffia rhodozyma]|uniref:Sister chromatid cohesion protein n=1 Tax=Phaffia rhodozyma TaxID=264483 RepID=A0A0F7SSP9_PHARH|nr:Sister chromatid cohesion protein SCC2/Nipped-B [Phaffia rhodozyma]
MYQVHQESPRPESNHPLGQDSLSTDNPGMIADPARLLAVYALGAPHTPSSSVAHHLSSLTISAPGLQGFLPGYHLRSEYSQQLAVLENGPSNDQEKNWLENQRTMVMVAIHANERANPRYQPPNPIPNPYPYQVPKSNIASSLLRSYPLQSYAYTDPYASSVPDPDITPSTSAAFFDSFVDQTVVSMDAYTQNTPSSALGYNHRQSSGTPALNTSSPSAYHDESTPTRTPTKLSRTSSFRRSSLEMNPVKTESSPSIKPYDAILSSSDTPSKVPLKRKPGTTNDASEKNSHDLFANTDKPVIKRAPTPPETDPVTSSDPLGMGDEDEILQTSLRSRTSSLTPIKLSHPRPSRTAGVPDDGTDDYMRSEGEESVPTPKKTKLSNVDSPSKNMDGLMSSRRSVLSTGGRDIRDPRKKLVELVEDIFESMDAIPYPVPSNYLLQFASSNYPQSVNRGTSTHPFFSRLISGTEIQPLLNPSSFRKLTKFTSMVDKSTGSWWGLDLGEGGPEKLITLLRRSLEEGIENGRAWEMNEGQYNLGADVDQMPRAKSSLLDEETSTLGISTPPSNEEYEEDIDRASSWENVCQTKLEIALEAVLAADTCLMIWTGKGIPKQICSEETIKLCLDLIKQLLVQIIYPYMEGLAGSTDCPEVLSHFLKVPSTVSQPHINLISQILQTLSLTFQHLRDLINSPDVTMSDDIVINAVYLAIGPFFVAEPQLTGKGRDRTVKGKASDAIAEAAGAKSLKGLRLDALGLLRAVFGKHESQRTWIIQEILTSLIKLPDVKKNQKQFNLRDGRSIHLVSALILQLIQTCTHTVKEDILRIRNRSNMRRLVDKKGGKAPKQTKQETYKEIGQIYAAANEAAVKSAKSIALFLVNTTASSKASKTSEAEHRAVLDMILHDLVTVLFWPEWPGASQLLTWFCKLMISSLNDEKTSAEDNASKSIALDHLGLIGARLRTSFLQASIRAKKAGLEDIGGVVSLPEIVSNLNLEQLDQLSSLESEMIEHLCRAATTDPSLASSYEYCTAIWGQEISLELSKLANSVLTDESDTEGLLNMTLALRKCLDDLWVETEGADLFNVGNSADIATLDIISEEINNTRHISNALDSILNAILFSLSSTSVTFRTKALKALGPVLAVDPTILKQANVRRTLETRLNDPSPAVRDVAVELLGKHLIQDPALIEKYLSLIGERVDDAGLAVRKRTIKLLRSLYSLTTSIPLKIDMCVKLIERIDDEDETVKDLAVHTIEELWFQEDDQVLAQNSVSRVTTRSSMQSKTLVFIGVAGCFKERQNPIESFLTQMVSDNAKKVDSRTASATREKFQELCDALIDLLIDASDQSDFSISNCIKAVYHLCVAYPGCIYSSKASHLLPYLRSPTNADEQAISSYLLKIFRQIVTKMPKTATTFAKKLEGKLLPMVNGAVGGSAGLQEIIACLCAVVNNITHNFERLVKLLGSCTAKLEAVRSSYEKTGSLPQNQRSICLLLYITALLGENCDFDELRKSRPELAADIFKIAKNNISDYIFRLIHSFRALPVIPAVSRAMIQSLGFLFREFPTFMVEAISLRLMDDMFASGDLETIGVLLNSIQDFLISQAARLPAQPDGSSREVNMTELIGDTETFAESGVGSTIVQRYLPKILDAALHLQTQYIAMEILTFTVKQGLAHPIQSAPIIIALETSADLHVASRAFSLHAILHHKHGSIINSRFFETARVCYDYQVKSAHGVVRGFRLTIQTSSVEPTPLALLRHWYGLLRDKRLLRKDFLRFLLRPFEVDLSTSPNKLIFSKNDVGFCLFLADNLATLEYKTQEEVLIVIHYLTSVISVTGMHLFGVISSMRPSTPLEEAASFDDRFIRVSKVLERRKRISKVFKQQNKSVKDEKESDEEEEDEDENEGTEVPEDSEEERSSLTPDPEDEMPQDEQLVTERSDSDVFYRASTLANVSVIISLAFVLRVHLKMLYNLSEDKCKKFVLGAKKSAIGEKPAIRQTTVAVALSLSSIPGATTPVTDMEMFSAQVKEFVSICELDGTVAEPEDS